ncbi:GNAT family N-acetyltransferase [Actinoplanes couchii]|uniref:N-acetyltransferase n=1 Tax=Actinoplanes couchii TaxID=403638 RepID=A0ABQ3X7C4_9ACTN|nr:GNAT family N-acetyltransferase [Actinoplanes couchii]MDR6322251.1 ribosomal protein S18 acetylase RimI-like enzyme [Actinoplanes couchii]GID54411.1 N-acetyltransferase [Actinoplanes couchii]
MPVRPALPADAAELAEIHVRTWQAAYAGLIPQDYLNSLEPAQREPGWRRWLSELRPPHAILVWAPSDPAGTASPAGSGLAGFITVAASRDPEPAARGIGEVYAIYVRDAHWGSGAGRELMAAGLRSLAASGFTEATLWVLASNVRARRFYEAAGWVPDGAAKVDSSRGFPLEEIRYRRSGFAAHGAVDADLLG